MLRSPDLAAPATGDPLWMTTANRFLWLCGLLAVQSLSSSVLERHKQVLQDHLVITLFLTMLVGAGGNAGAQAAVTVIQGIASGKITTQTKWRYLMTESMLGLVMAMGMFVAGYVRVRLSGETHVEALAISICLFVIVCVAVVVGATLPLVMHFVLHMDPVNAGSTIQVVMDIAGVTITILLCDMMFAHT